MVHGKSQENPEQSGHSCEVCHTVTELRVCSKCKSVSYCSETCQRSHWKTHKKSCSKPRICLEDSVTICFYSRDSVMQKEHTARKSATTYLRYIERNCFSNCIMNIEPLESLAGCALTATAGSLGLCSPTPTWYEWGGYGDVPHTTVKQFSSCPVTGLPDVHFWFESEDGKIWDVLDLYLIHTVAPVHKKTIDCSGLVHGCFIAGKTRVELESIGLKYISTTPLIEHILIEKHAANTAITELK